MDVMDQLDALIDKRGKQNAAEREAMYAESVRRYYERRREHNRQLWRTYHLERAECLERTAASLVPNTDSRPRLWPGRTWPDQNRNLLECREPS